MISFKRKFFFSFLFFSFLDIVFREFFFDSHENNTSYKILSEARVIIVSTRLYQTRGIPSREFSKGFLDQPCKFVGRRLHSSKALVVPLRRAQNTIRFHDGENLFFFFFIFSFFFFQHENVDAETLAEKTTDPVRFLGFNSTRQNLQYIITI